MTNPNKDAVPEGAIITELVERLRAQAVSASKASEWLARSKGDGYMFLSPQQTLEWRAADALSAALPFLSQPHEGIGEDAKPLTIVYTNWRGETAERRVLPLRIWWGSTDWHPEPQWLMTAWDIEKAAERDFAWNGIDFRPALSPIPSPHGEAARDERQTRVAEWCAAAFGAEHQASVPQRGLRMLEEAIEAYQAIGGSPGQAHKLIDYIFAKEPGEMFQELGGLGITVLALAAAAGVSADAAEQTELARVLAKPLEWFHARNKAKNDAGFDATAYPIRSELQPKEPGNDPKL